jgi:DNA mismatch repair protein MutH
LKAPDTENELFANASSLAGVTLGELAGEANLAVPSSLHHAKGWVGELLERRLGATAQSRPVPDFEKIGVELKTIPLNRHLMPQESTFVSSAPLSHTAGLRWVTSSVKAKLNRVLWVPIEAATSLPVAQRRVGIPILWSPSLGDMEILRYDWEEHIERIALGHLDEIDARLGTYLQVRPKALNRDARTATTDSRGAPAATLPRGFYLRTSFTRKILGDY